MRFARSKRQQFYARRKPTAKPLRFESLESRRMLSTIGLSPVEHFFESAVLIAPGRWEIGDKLKLTLTPEMLSDNANAADTVNADQLRSGGGLGLDLDGSGVTVGIWDSGRVRDTHDEFQIAGGGSRVTIVDTGAALSDHSTHVAGTIGAQGSDAAARGMASNVMIRSRDSVNDSAELAADAAGIDLSNHSYSHSRGWQLPLFTVTINNVFYPVDTWVGDRDQFAVENAIFGKYEDTQNPIDAALGQSPLLPSEIDQIAFDNPTLLSVWSAGNDRDDVFTNALRTATEEVQGLPNYDQFYVAFDGTLGQFVFIDGTVQNNEPPPGDGNGGTGYDSLPQSKVAKNTLVIGAIGDIVNIDGPYDPANPPPVTMTSFSSWGPTDDGRIKPDVVANGDALYSSEAASDTDYGTRSGTSMAAPSVTGTAALLLEHYRDLNVVRNLTAGDHDIRVEYYEDVDDARLTLHWARPGVAKTVVPASVLWHDNPQVAGLDAEYFDFSTTLSDIPDFTGLTPDVTNVATQLDFAPTAGHWAGLTSDYDDTFAARYTGTINIATTDDYTFSLLADDEARLWIDDVLVNESPRSATLKGLIIHTAQDVTSGAANIGPDYSTGWGLVDAAAAVEFLTGSLSETGHTTELFEGTYDGTEWTHRVRADGNNPLRVTIVWTDPAPTTLPGDGLDDPTSVLVNDLDIWITDASDTTLYRPWNLDPANPATRREEYSCAA